MPDLLPGMQVTEATLGRLRAFNAALAHWSARINLIAPTSLDESWSRHILDSAQLLTLAPEGARHWVDLGSGGGLPGLVLAILARGTALRFTMVEADHRKSAFLRQQTNEHGLDVAVQTGRAESVPPQRADVVSARALAPLDRLLPMVVRHLGPEGIALLPKGRRWATELAEARVDGVFHVEPLPSALDPEARILRISQIRRTA